MARAICIADTADQKRSLDDIKRTLKIAEAQLKQNSFDYPEAIAEGSDVVWEEYKPVQDLGKKISTYWRIAFDNLDQVAPTECDKITMVVACQGIANDSDYISFLEQATSLCEQGALSKVALYTGLFPEIRHRDVLENNRGDPRVQALYSRLNAIFSDNQNWLPVIKLAIKGGTGRDIERRERDIAIFIFLASLSTLAFIARRRFVKKKRRAQSTVSA